MIRIIDSYISTHHEIDGKWVIARPVDCRCDSFWGRLRAAWWVLIRRADAVTCGLVGTYP